MIVTIGSKNPNKIKAVSEAFHLFPLFMEAEFRSASVPSGVPDQPIGLEETIRGAKQRAENAFSECDLSVGLESGLMPVPLTRSGYMNFSVCAVFNGREVFLGLGPAFELPPDITRMVVERHMELDDAIFASGFSDNPRIGYSEGIIGMLTGGAVTRKDYMVPAVCMAMAGFLPTLKK
jgi:inosine/xanthosine triphosphatase